MSKFTCKNKKPLYYLSSLNFMYALMPVKRTKKIFSASHIKKKRAELAAAKLSAKTPEEKRVCKMVEEGIRDMENGDYVVINPNGEKLTHELLNKAL